MTDHDTSEHKPVFHYEGGVPVFDAQRIDDLAREQEDAKKRDAKYKEDQLTVNRRLTTFTGALALCAVLAGGVSAWQAHIANKTLAEIRKSKVDTNRIIAAAETQAGAATKIAGAARSFSTSADKIRAETANAVTELKREANVSEKAVTEASQNAKKTLDASISASKLDQRPWIGGRGATIIQFKPTDRFQAQIIFVNTGKTPALNVRFCRRLFVSARGELGGPWDYQYPGAPCSDIGALPPQSPFIMEATDDPSYFVEKQYKEIMDGTSFLYVWGYVAYWDTSFVPTPATHVGDALPVHWTRFCFEYDRLTSQFGLCQDKEANIMN